MRAEDHSGRSMQSFFPYRLAILADAVSRAVAAIYEEKFGLGRAEWRILAALADLGPATATQLGAYSTLDKMQVSRGLRDMEGRGLVSRLEGRADRRTKQVMLTQKGRNLFDNVLPLVREKEAELLAALADDQRDAFLRGLDALADRLKQDFAG